MVECCGGELDGTLRNVYKAACVDNATTENSGFRRALYVFPQLSQQSSSSHGSSLSLLALPVPIPSELQPHAGTINLAGCSVQARKAFFWLDGPSRQYSLGIFKVIDKSASSCTEVPKPRIIGRTSAVYKLSVSDNNPLNVP